MVEAWIYCAASCHDRRTNETKTEMTSLDVKNSDAIK